MEHQQSQSETAEHSHDHPETIEHSHQHGQSETTKHPQSHLLSNNIPHKYLDVVLTEQQTKLMKERGVNLTSKQRKTLRNLKMSRLPKLPNTYNILRSARRERNHGRRNNDPVNYSASECAASNTPTSHLHLQCASKW